MKNLGIIFWNFYIHPKFKHYEFTLLAFANDDDGRGLIHICFDDGYWTIDLFFKRIIG